MRVCRFSKDLVGLVLLGCAFACAKQPDRPASNATVSNGTVDPQLAPANREIVRVKADRVEIRGQKLSVPPSLIELKKAIGDSSRTSDLVNTISTWDDLGVLAYTKPGSDKIKALTFMFGELQKNKFAPKTASRHDVAFGSNLVTPSWGPKQLQAAGFTAPELLPMFWSTAVGDVTVSVELDDETRTHPVSISLDFSSVGK